MKEKIFSTEEEMQEWLSGQLENENISDIVSTSEIDEFSPSGRMEKKILDVFRYCFESFHITHVITENKNISIQANETLKPDFLLYAPETNSILVIELKNAGNASRQAGTELSAYVSEVKTQLPFIAEGEIINIIVSSEWPTLLKHYIVNEIYWLRKNIICLEPIKEDGDINLQIINPRVFSEVVPDLKFSERHLGGYQLCLYDYSHPVKSDRYIEQMKTAIYSMANQGEAHFNHGFAFLWRDTPPSISPYNITIINVAPFNLIERNFHTEDYSPENITLKFIEIIREHCPEGHGQSLDTISTAGEVFLKGFCSPQPEGFMSWLDLKNTMISRADPLLAFASWGIFRDLFNNKLIVEYEKGNCNTRMDDPHLGLALINDLVDEDYEFIDLTYYEDLVWYEGKYHRTWSDPDNDEDSESSDMEDYS